MYSDSLFLSLLLSPSVIYPVVFPESSLTPENLSTVLDVMSDGRWERFGRFVNTPESELERIKGQYTSDRECKQALIHSFISSHPAPSWSLVAWALYQIGSLSGDDGNCHKALDRLQQLFPTGKIFCVKQYHSPSPEIWSESIYTRGPQYVRVLGVCSPKTVTSSYIDFPMQGDSAPNRSTSKR